jgi:GntR family transcriptional repressor for pyruvate dehydrogenase complex
MIAGGHVKAGDRLPPERELAQLFGVGRSTLREAVRVLESLGLVEVRAGEGTFLAEGDAATTQAQLPPALFSKWTTQVNLFELRTVLEPGLASLAARRATADYLTKMHEALAAQAAQVQRGELGTDEDATFHELIAEATRNPALIHLMQHLARSLRETRDSSLQRDGRPTRSLWENRAILAAIEARKPTLAARRMQAHIRSLERVLFTTDLQPAEVLRSIPAGGNGAHSETVMHPVSASVDNADT